MDIIYLIIPNITVLLFWLFVHKYLTSYLDNKAKNLAQKEDIAAITKEIEATKLEFSIEIEKIKSSLTKEVEQTIIRTNEKSKVFAEFIDVFTRNLASLNSWSGDKVPETRRTETAPLESEMNAAITKMAVYIHSRSVIDEIIKASHLASPGSLALIVNEIRRELGYEGELEPEQHPYFFNKQ